MVSLESLLEDKLNEWKSPPVLRPLSIAVADHEGLKTMDSALFLTAKPYMLFFFFWKRSQARFSWETQFPDLAKLTSHGQHTLPVCLYSGL